MFVRGRGVEVMDEVRWYVAEHEGLSLQAVGLEGEDENGPTSADARYLRVAVSPFTLNASATWDQLKTDQGLIPVWLRGEVLESDEHTLYVLSHELFELSRLKETFGRRDGRMTYREIAFLIDPRLRGAIHEDAVRHSDELVRRLRAERGVDR